MGIAPSRRVVVASDHAGVPLKRDVVAHLHARGLPLVDVGIDDESAADDYPDRAADLARALLGGEAEIGLLLCGSGAGAAIAANKIHGIRAAVCHDTFSAHQVVEDDDANVLCLGARIIGPSLALEVVDVFLHATFSGLERHARRLGKVLALERSGTP